MTALLALLSFVAGALSLKALQAWDQAKSRHRMEAWKAIRAGTYRGRIPLLKRLEAEGVYRDPYAIRETR